MTEESIGLYVCGVTPYDTTHLGHAFTYTAFDVLIRYLRFLGREVTYVRNVTDIDDDVLLRARVDGRSTGRNWATASTRSSRRIWRRLNNLDPEFEPRATEHIPEIVQITAGPAAKGLRLRKRTEAFTST